MKIILNNKKMKISNSIKITELIKAKQNSAIPSVIYINGKIISPKLYDSLEIKEGDVVKIVPLVAGG